MTINKFLSIKKSIQNGNAEISELSSDEKMEYLEICQKIIDGKNALAEQQFQALFATGQYYFCNNEIPDVLPKRSVWIS